MPVPKKIYSLNEIGGRKNNEDSIWPKKGWALPKGELYLVCDGVGGNSHGEVASELACKYIAEYFSANLKTEDALDDSFIASAREHAMTHFRAYISDHPDAEKMSTTLTLAYLKKQSLFVAWCGDSKIFLIREGDIIFQSEDHSLVNELVKRGDISPEEAATHPHRNVITRSLQVREPYSEIQTHELKDLREGDVLLLCSDGVTENVTPEVLRTILTEGDDDNIVEKFQSYCLGKTRDNYSMYLVELAAAPAAVSQPAAPGHALKAKSGSRALTYALVLVAAILLAVAYANYNHYYWW